MQSRRLPRRMLGLHRQRGAAVAVTMLVLAASFAPMGRQVSADGFDLDGPCGGYLFVDANGTYINHPKTIMQNAADQDPTALCNFEQTSLSNYDASQGVTWSDDEHDRMYSYGRDDARAVLFANLIADITKAPGDRSSDEQAAYGWIASRVKRLKVAQAQASVDEYHEWKSNPCAYQPPSPYTYSPNCNSQSLLVLFSGPPAPPSYEDFVRYGAVDVLQNIYHDDGALAAAATSRALAEGLAVGALAVGGTAVAVTAAAAASALAVSVSTIFPYTAIAAGAIAGATVAAIAGAVVFCVVLAVARGIQISDQAKIPDQLATDLDNAKATTPDLLSMTQNKNDMGVLFAAYLSGTLPDYPHPSFAPTPAASPDGTTLGFVESGGTSSSPTYQQSVTFLDPDGNLSHAWLDHGWWVVHRADGSASFLTRHLAFLDASFRVAEATFNPVRTPHFTVRYLADPHQNLGCPSSACDLTDTLHFLSVPLDGSSFTGFLDVADTFVGPPLRFTQTPTLAANYQQRDSVHLVAYATGPGAGGNVAERWIISHPNPADPDQVLTSTLYGTAIDYRFRDSGTYTVELTAVDQLGQAVTWTGVTTVAAKAQPIVITQTGTDRDGNPMSGYWLEGNGIWGFVPGTLRISAPESVSSTFQIDWDDDGTFDETATGSSASFRQPSSIDSAGDHPVTIAVTTDDGVTTTVPYDVHVQNEAPYVNGIQVKNGQGNWTSQAVQYTEGETVQARFLVGDGAGDTETATVTWSDGTTRTMTGLVPGTWYEVSHTYIGADASGGVTVGLVDNNGAASAPMTKSFTVVAVAPVVDALQTTVDADGNATVRTTYSTWLGDAATSYAIDWGDGTASTSGSLPMNITDPDDPSVVRFSSDTIEGAHHYTASGDYQVTVQATNAGGTTTRSTTLSIVDLRLDKPTLLDLGTNAPEQGFLTISTSDPDPADTPQTLRLHIDWGDGSPVQHGSYDPDSGTFPVTHQYATDGTYTVTVTAVDAAGTASEPLVGKLVVTDGSPGHQRVQPDPIRTGPGLVGPSVRPRSVTVTNDGGNLATVGTLGLSGAGRSAFALSADTCSGTTLLPGGTCTVEIGFTAPAEGRFDATLHVPDTTEQSEATVGVQGGGVALLLEVGTTGRVDFGSVDDGSTVQHLVGLTNTSDAAVSLERIGIDGIVSSTAAGPSLAAPTPVLIDSTIVEGFSVDSTTCLTVLDPGDGCWVTVDFTPSSPGVHQASLAISGPLASSATLSGTGVGPSAPSSTTSSTMPGGSTTTVAGGSTTTAKPGSTTTVPPSVTTTSFGAAPSTTRAAAVGSGSLESPGTSGGAQGTAASSDRGRAGGAATSGSSSLPRTGAASGLLALVALVLLGAGLVLVAARRSTRRV